MNSRNDWVDYAKAIGIVLVVVGHVERGLVSAGILSPSVLQALVDSVIYSFHMPLFFFLSGLFFIQTMNRRGAGGTMLSKIDTVFYPFVLWSILQGTIEVVLARYTNGDLTLHRVFELLWHPRAQFWFLYALFMVFLVSVVMYRSRVLYLPILGFWATIYTFQRFLPELGVGDFLVQNAVFFSLGVCFAAYPVGLDRRPALWALLIGGLFVVAEYVFHGVLERKYVDRGAVSLAVAVLGIYLTVVISMWAAAQPKRWVLLIGTMSMHIYLMHILTGSGVRVILDRVFGVDDPAVHMVLGTLAGVVIPIVAAQILLKMNFGFLFAIPDRLSLAKRWGAPPSRAVAT